eukprot:373386-Amphidinium_carterae.1
MVESRERCEVAGTSCVASKQMTLKAAFAIDRPLGKISLVINYQASRGFLPPASTSALGR